MSLVGTRPPTVDEYEQYERLILYDSSGCYISDCQHGRSSDKVRVAFRVCIIQIMNFQNRINDA